MVTTIGRFAWVLLAYRVPREPSTPRIAIWRRLKRLGVAQLGDGLVALPADARTQEHLEWMSEQVVEAGGTCTLWRAELTSRAQESAVIAAMVAERGREYAAITHRAEAALVLPPSEAQRALRSLRRELRQIQRRDFFPPPERDTASLALRRLADRVVPVGAGQVSRR